MATHESLSVVLWPCHELIALLRSLFCSAVSEFFNVSLRTFLLQSENRFLGSLQDLEGFELVGFENAYS